MKDMKCHLFGKNAEADRENQAQYGGKPQAKLECSPQPSPIVSTDEYRDKPNERLMQA